MRRLALGVVAVLGVAGCGGDDGGSAFGDGPLGGSAASGEAQLVELIAGTGGGLEADRECISDLLADLPDAVIEELSDFYDLRTDELSPDAVVAEEELGVCFHERAGGSDDELPSDEEVIAAVLDRVANYRVSDDIDEDCVRDYVRDHSNWQDFSQLASEARLDAIAGGLALAVNDLC